MKINTRDEGKRILTYDGDILDLIEIVSKAGYNDYDEVRIPRRFKHDPELTVTLMYHPLLEKVVWEDDK